jgi:two-component system sensor histidine kinase RegB
MTASANHPVRVHWLVRLRWAAIAAQVGSIAGVRFLLRAPFPLLPLVSIVVATAVVNVLLWLWLRRGSDLSSRAIAAHLLFDIAALTGLLVWTGGAMNPFTTLYVLQVALAAILVPRRWSLAVAAGAVAAFGALLLARPEAIHVWHSGSMFMLHVRGMWVAFALTAACLWFFVDRVSAALRQRDELLAKREIASVRAERMASLATLAAGAAHELNTPLGTMAILAAELADTIRDRPDAAEQADRIRAEVRRCAGILAKMRSHEPRNDAHAIVEFASWLAPVVNEWATSRAIEPIALVVEPNARSGRARILPELLRQSIHNLLDNAWAAVDGVSGAIDVRVQRVDRESLRLVVRDRGTGIAPSDLAHVGEPFFTTREPGEGMGLGLFLAQATIAQLEGSLAIESRPGLTEVALTLPLLS